jgi:twinkle protein
VGSSENTLFGQDTFAGGGKKLIITEGEIDALTVAQAHWEKYGKIFPVVSIPSASTLKPLLENREWIRSFSEVVLWFDNDEPGKKAIEKAIRLIGSDKVKIVKSNLKDANAVYMEEGKDGYYEIMQVIWNAEDYVPSGIVSKEDLWERLVEYNNKVSVPYPPCLEGVTVKTKGHRGGEIALFISGTGAGKSTLLKEDMLYILQNTEDKIGIVSLEEAPEDTARKLAGMELELNPANEEIPLDILKVGFDNIFGDDRIILLDHSDLSMKDDSIIGKIEYMALSGCKYIYVDHITILVSEGVDGLSGNEAQDHTMNELLRLVKRNPEVWIGLVSHLRKVPTGGTSFEQGRLPSLDDIKGSGSIKQVSFDIIAFARDMTLDDDIKRNIIQMSVLKCRHTGLTGPVKGAFYVYETGRLIPEDEAPVEEFTEIPLGE